MNTIRIHNKEYKAEEVQENIYDNRISGVVIDLEAEAQAKQLELETKQQEYAALQTVEEKLQYIAKELNLIADETTQ